MTDARGHLLAQYAAIATSKHKAGLRVAGRIARDVGEWCGDDGIVKAAEAPKDERYGALLCAQMQSIAASHKGRVALRAALWKHATHDWVPAEVATKLFDGSIENNWLSLTDAEAFSVITSIPVIEADSQKALESVLLACQAASGAFGGNALMEPSVHTLLMQSDDIRRIQVPAECAPLRDLAADIACMQTPEARRELRGRVVAGLQATANGVAVARFLRALRGCYTESEIARAFAQQNLSQSTHGTDRAHIQRELGKLNLGALASAYIATEDLTKAWQTMNLRGYLEVARLVPGPNLARVIVKALVKRNMLLLRDTLIDGSYGSDVVLHVLTAPSMKDYGLSDIRNKDASAKEFVLNLLRLADLARSANGTVTDDILHTFTVLLNTHVVRGQQDGLRRVCERCIPMEAGLRALNVSL